jgi:hypothetical protein
MQNDSNPRILAFSLKQNIILLCLFVLSAPLVLFSSFTLLRSVNLTAAQFAVSDNKSIFTDIQYGVQVYASLPSTIPSISTEIGAADARVAIVRQYLQRYNSPLYPLAGHIVETADEYGLDYRLTTAIAQQESNLCKIIPPESFNCWGWGIHSQGSLGFLSYEEGITTVTAGLKNNYLNLGYKTVDEIMSKYTPLSNGSWASGVISFMNEMQ